MKLRIKFLEVGLETQTQRQNIYSISFVVDLLRVTSSACQCLRKMGCGSLGDVNVECVMVGVGLLIVGAANTYTTDKLSSPDFILFKFVKGCLNKCFGLCEGWACLLHELLETAV